MPPNTSRRAPATDGGGAAGGSASRRRGAAAAPHRRRPAAERPGGGSDDDFEDYAEAAAAYRRGHSSNGNTAGRAAPAGQWGIPEDDGSDDFEFDGFTDEALSTSAEADSNDFAEMPMEEEEKEEGRLGGNARRGGGAGRKPESRRRHRSQYEEEDEEEEDDDDDEDSGDDFAEAEREQTRRRPMTPTVVDLLTPDAPLLCSRDVGTDAEALPCCRSVLPAEVHTGHAPADCETRITRLVMTIEPVPTTTASATEHAIVPAQSPMALAAGSHGPVPLFAAPSPSSPVADGASVASPVLPHIATPLLPPKRKAARSESQRNVRSPSAFDNAVPTAADDALLEAHHVDWGIRLVLRIHHDPTTIPAEMANRAPIAAATTTTTQPPPPPCQHTDLVLCELGPSRPQVDLKSVIPAGATYTLHALAAVGGDATIPLASILPDVAVRVTLKGEHVPRAGATNLFVHRRWFTVASNVTRAPLTSPDGAVAYAPPGSVIEVQRVEGNVLYLADGRDHHNHGKRGLKDCGSMPPQEKLQLRCSQRVVADMLDWVPYAKWFTPARRGKTVRIRRFPHRNADVIGTLEHGASALARGQTRDPATGDLYVVWADHADGAYSRLRGDGGLFLIENGRGAADAVDDAGEASSVEALTPSVWFCPSSSSSVNSNSGCATMKPLAIRASTAPKARVVGHVEANEVKEAVAIHRSVADGRTLLQWGGAGGFSVLSDGGGPDHFVRCPPLDQPLRCRIRESRIPPPTDRGDGDDPEIIELPCRAQQQRRQRRRGDRGDKDDDAVKVPLTSENGPEKYSEEQRRSDDRRRPVVDAADTDPALYELRRKLGTLSFAEYPRVALGGYHRRGGGGGSSDDEGSDFDDDDDDDDEDGYSYDNDDDGDSDDDDAGAGGGFGGLFGGFF